MSNNRVASVGSRGKFASREPSLEVTSTSRDGVGYARSLRVAKGTSTDQKQWNRGWHRYLGDGNRGRDLDHADIDAAGAWKGTGKTGKGQDRALN